MTTYTQTDSSVSNGPATQDYLMSAGATAGTLSHSVSVASQGVGVVTPLSFGTSLGIPGTASWVGACTMRLEITTANSNITWSGMNWGVICRATGGSGSVASDHTTTSALGISLGTTGVKTASIEAVTITTVNLCSTVTASTYVSLRMSNAATMAATFNFKNSQDVTVPFTSSAAPAPSAIFTLAQMNVGQ